MKPCSFTAHRNTFISDFEESATFSPGEGVQGIRHISVEVIAIIAKLGGVAFR